MKMQIEKDGAPLSRGRMAKLELGKELGPIAALRLPRTSPESLGGATSDGAKSSRGGGRRKLAKCKVNA